MTTRKRYLFQFGPRTEKFLLGRDLSRACMSEISHRRSVFFELRGLLGFVVLSILVFHHAFVSPKLWLLGISFLASDLLMRFLPVRWFRNPGAGYAVFFLDIAV